MLSTFISLDMFTMKICSASMVNLIVMIFGVIIVNNFSYKYGWRGSTCKDIKFYRIYYSIRSKL